MHCNRLAGNGAAPWRDIMNVQRRINNHRFASALWLALSMAPFAAGCQVEVAEVPGRELPEAVLDHLLERGPAS